MTDKFNPYESNFGPGDRGELSIEIPLSEIIAMLTKAKEEHPEEYLKDCPYCGNKVIFYKDDWLFCQQHMFVKLGG
jgi:hypothetical protein